LPYQSRKREELLLQDILFLVTPPKKFVFNTASAVLYGSDYHT